MAAVPMQPYNQDIEAMLSRVRELAVLPHVVYKVIEISATTDTSTAEIERAIVVDPGFSSKLLTIANSAYYALPRKVTSIREAILFLGFKTIRQLAMTVGIYDMFIGKTDKESLRRRAWWRQSVDAAVCAGWLAKKSGKVPPEDAYTCGLLHLIGKTILDRFGGRDYESVCILMKNGFPDITAEQSVYGFCHMEVAAAAAHRWGFPEPLVSGLYYLEPADDGDPNAAYRASVSLATKIVQWAMEGTPEDQDASERNLPGWALQALAIDPGIQEDFVRGGTQVIAEAAALQM